MRIKYITIIFASLLLGIVRDAEAKLNVVTTTTDMRALVQEVGGGDVTVDAIAKGTQDPHFIEAKPSFMAKVNHADLVVSVGLDLEVGWLPSILLGARNPKVNQGSKGFLELGPAVNPIEVPSGKITRAEGDVHPFGNPHFSLDPIRMGDAAIVLAERLGQIDPSHSAGFMERAKSLQSRLAEKTKEWQKRVDASGVHKVVTYHKTLNYFLDRFHIGNPTTLEPKPGIPPTSAHILEVIGTIREQKIPLILVENFFDPTVTNRIRQDVPSVRVEVVPVAVDGASGVSTIDDLYERLVSAIEGKKP